MISETLMQKDIRPFDPENQHRVIRERLHSLDIINERFARQFRIGIFNYVRRNPDITVESMRYMSYANFSHEVPSPTAINMMSLKPLQGTALMMFSSDMVFFVVDSLFGGDGRFGLTKEKKSFTATENRIIQRLLELSSSAYDSAWESVYPIETKFNRFETQAKFANITNSPNDVVVLTTFKIEIGDMVTHFSICIPYAMIEPIKEVLINPIIDGQEVDHEGFTKKMAGEVKQSGVLLTADFVNIDMQVSSLTDLKQGDILPIELPEIIQAKIDGVPVMDCKFGTKNGHHALRVVNVIDHGAGHIPVSGITPKTKSPAPNENLTVPEID